jgi:hypothetical protein
VEIPHILKRILRISLLARTVNREPALFWANRKLFRARRPVGTFRLAKSGLFGLPVKYMGWWPEISKDLYFTANNFWHNSSDSLAPSSDSHTDLFFVAGLEM